MPDRSGLGPSGVNRSRYCTVTVTGSEVNEPFRATTV